jgi:hypothetical protein
MSMKTQFEKHVKAFLAATLSSMEHAKHAAEISLAYFEKEGDLSLAQTWLDTISVPKLSNYIRRAAYVKWLCAFSPAMVDQETGRFKKDKSPEANPFDLEKAAEKPFWDYAPNPENIQFGSPQVITALTKALAKFGGKNYTPVGRASIALELGKAMVDDLERHINDMAVEVAQAEEVTPVSENDDDVQLVKAANVAA